MFEGVIEPWQSFMNSYFSRCEVGMPRGGNRTFVDTDDGYLTNQ